MSRQRDEYAFKQVLWAVVGLAIVQAVFWGSRPVGALMATRADAYRRAGLPLALGWFLGLTMVAVFIGAVDLILVVGTLAVIRRRQAFRPLTLTGVLGLVAWISIAECELKMVGSGAGLIEWIGGGLGCFIGTAPLYALLVGVSLAGMKYVSTRMSTHSALGLSL